MRVGQQAWTALYQACRVAERSVLKRGWTCDMIHPAGRDEETHETKAGQDSGRATT
ncbi:hypothetical protein ACFW4D_24210 [Paenibacillus lactis]|uniref:hypothetical protein n=1 Tax=Paenibacillus lactis TaxID=228574 RepID=UPI001643E4B4